MRHQINSLQKLRKASLLSSCSFLLSSLFITCLLVSTESGYAQWTPVGTPGLSAGYAQSTSLAFSPKNGMPYLLYTDGNEGYKATVLSYNGTQWQPIGTPGFSAGSTDWNILAFSPDGTPYVAYSDFGNGGRATVMKYNGSGWVTVGNAGFSAGGAIAESLAFGPDGTLYLAYVDAANSNRATVMKYDGVAWQPVGNAGFTSNGVQATYLAINPKDGTPYLAYYSNYNNNNEAILARYNGSQWDIIGTPGFSANTSSPSSLAFSPKDSATLYMSYIDGASNLSVVTYDGTSWNLVGAFGFATKVAWEDFAFGPDGTPYVAFQDQNNSKNATTVMKYDGVSWVMVGSPGFSAGTADYTSLAFSPYGVPYVAYRDYGNNSKATVMKYQLPCPVGPVVYVNANVSGGAQDGSSWANAYTKLQDALSATKNCTDSKQIWVAKGTYYPNEITVQTDSLFYPSFVLKKNLAIYGGFTGTETVAEQRNVSGNPTVLSGDIDKNDTLDNRNTDGVVFSGGSNTDSTAILDGFTITQGYAFNSGGGLSNKYSSPTIRNCTFFSNYANTSGGAVSNFFSTPHIINCTFYGNSSYFGGGMDNDYSSPIITNCVFSGNTALYGGGMSTKSAGSGNTTITNCTFSGNKAISDGGGLYFDTHEFPNMSNSIIWNNNDRSGTGTQNASVYDPDNSLVIYRSLIQGKPGSNDPQFIIPVNPSTAPTTTGNLRLLCTSPAVDKGINSANTTSTDRDGNARIVNSTIDLGAYEQQGGCVVLPVTTVTTVTSSLNPSCFGTNVIFTATVSANGNSTTLPTGTVSFFDGGSLLATVPADGNGQASFSTDTLGAGLHTIVANYNSDANFSSSTGSLVQKVNALPVVSFSGLASSYCSNLPPVALTGNPSGGTFNGPGITGNAFNPAAAGTGGTVTYSYTDGNGCSNSSSQPVAVAAAPSKPAITVTNNCGSSILSTTATGGLTWSTGGTTSSITVSAAGSYYLVQTTGFCTSDTAFATAAPKAVPPAPAVTVINNCGSSALTASNYTGTLLWSNNATSSPIVVTAPGTYTVTQTVNGCTSAQGSGMAVPKVTPPAPTVTVTNNCGSSTLTANNYTGSLLWSTNATTPSIKVYTAGTYTVTQTVNGCTSAPGSGTAAPAKTLTLTTSNLFANTGSSCSASVAFGAGINVTVSGPATLTYKIGSKVITSPYTFSTGITTVTVSATNACSCVSKCFTVTVSDKTAPAVTCKPGATKMVSCGYYTVNGKEFDATATDNCTLSTLAYSVSGATNICYSSCNTTLAGKRLNVGTNTITWTATDKSGNKSSCTTIVTVKKSGSSNFTADDRIITSLQPEAELSVRLSPVPARDNLTVSANGFSGKVLLQVFSSDGRQVKQQNRNLSSIGTLQQNFDISSLAAGSYLLVVSDEKGNRKTEKFIVSR